MRRSPVSSSETAERLSTRSKPPLPSAVQFFSPHAAIRRLQAASRERAFGRAAAAKAAGVPAVGMAGSLHRGATSRPPRPRPLTTRKRSRSASPSLPPCGSTIVIGRSPADGSRTRLEPRRRLRRIPPRAGRVPETVVGFTPGRRASACHRLWRRRRRLGVRANCAVCELDSGAPLSRCRAVMMR